MGSNFVGKDYAPKAEYFDHKGFYFAPIKGYLDHKLDFDQGRLDIDLPYAVGNHKEDKHYVRHTDCEVVAPVDPSNKVIGPVATGVYLVPTRFNLVDI